MYSFTDSIDGEQTGTIALVRLTPVVNCTQTFDGDQGMRPSPANRFCECLGRIITIPPLHPIRVERVQRVGLGLLILHKALAGGVDHRRCRR